MTTTETEIADKMLGEINVATGEERRNRIDDYVAFVGACRDRAVAGRGGLNAPTPATYYCPPSALEAQKPASANLPEWTASDLKSALAGLSGNL